MEQTHGQLTRLFRRCPVMDMAEIGARAGGRSVRSLYRDLSKLGYLSSFTHAGRYYTLAGVPDFDEDGLWFHHGIGFSRAGTLKETAAVMVEAAEAGCTHPELEARLRVRVHNTLLGLVREQRLGRERLSSRYVYVSADAARRAEQIEGRRALLAGEVNVVAALPAEMVIAVLVEALQASEGLAPSGVVAGRLSARGEHVSAAQVERIYSEYELVPGKKTAQPH